MKTTRRNAESGVALLFAILALFLLTAIGAAMVFMSTTETSIDSNFRQEQIAYFGAKAGLEEARARMMLSDPHTINVVGNASQPLLDPNEVAEPDTANYMIYYIVNDGNSANSVEPWNDQNAYADDELCHEGYTLLGLTEVAPDVRCTATDLSGSTYVSYNSTLPYAGTSSALPFKWVRIAPKLNGSVTYLQGSGSTASISTYFVNSNPSVTVNGTPVSIGSSTLICWDGEEEVPLTATSCPKMKSTAGLFAGAPMTYVYLITSLGVSPTGARSMVQAEAALQPMPPFQYGLFATSTSCPAMTFTGTNPTTDGYTTANGQTYAETKNSTWGGVGSNGGISLQNGNIGGSVGVMAPTQACPQPDTIGPGGTQTVGSTSCPSGDSAQCYQTSPYVFPTPPPPNPLPPTTSYTPPLCGSSHNSGQCMVPGTYGNITINGTLYLTPGTYNINSLGMQGNALIIVSPPGAVTLNVAGTGVTTAVGIGGNGITDDSDPNDFVINYGGTDAVNIAGNGTVTAILDAPNAPITQTGNGAWYGSIVGSTMQIGGNGFFHFDTNAATAPDNNGYYTMVGYRTVPY